MEEWKNIPGYDEMYQVSNYGRVRSWKNNKWGRSTTPSILSLRTDKKGYLRVNLWENNNCKNFQVHRLVAESFVSNPNNKPQINHKNGIKDDNAPKNLEWCTCKENINHYYNNLT